MMEKSGVRPKKGVCACQEAVVASGPVPPPARSTARAQVNSPVYPCPALLRTHTQAPLEATLGRAVAHVDAASGRLTGQQAGALTRTDQDEIRRTRPAAKPEAFACRVDERFRFLDFGPVPIEIRHVVERSLNRDDGGDIHAVYRHHETDRRSVLIRQYIVVLLSEAACQVGGAWRPGDRSRGRTRARRGCPGDAAGCRPTPSSPRSVTGWSAR